LRWKHRAKQTLPIVAVTLLVILSLALCLAHWFNTVRGITKIASGSNFDLYFPSGSAFQFQHLAQPFQPSMTAKVTVTSGVLNGTNGSLSMTVDGGSLSFLSRNTATLTTTNATITVNGVSKGTSASIISSDNVQISWSAPAFEPFLPLMFIFGMVGLFGMFVGPAYTIHKVKHREYYDGFVTGFILTVTGLVLFIAWIAGA